MKNEQNLLLDVLNEIPEEEVLELAVKCLYYKNEGGELIEYTGNYDDSESVDGDKKDFGPLHFYNAGVFIGRLLDRFKELKLNKDEDEFLVAIGYQLHARFEDWANEIKRLKGTLKSQSKEHEAELKELRENYKKLTTAYNELHHQYKQLKKE